MRKLISISFLKIRVEPLDADAVESPSMDRHIDLPSSPQPAGFWLRLLAMLMDLILITALVATVAWLAVRRGLYIPIELTVLLAVVVYTIGCEAQTGQTIGKWLCGLIVTTRDGEPAGSGHLLLRETVGKLVSFLPLGLGEFARDTSRSQSLAYSDGIHRRAMAVRSGVANAVGRFDALNDLVRDREHCSR